MIDPYRTLGLQPGATAAEVKRAYRRLAKAYHPDSAGQAALDRFLAIQQAYELLASSPRAGRATKPTPGRGAAGAGAAGGTSGAPGAGAGEPWRADPARARAAREQARARARGGTRDGAGTAGASGAPSGSGGRPGATAGGRAGGSTSTRKRAPRKATMGSTSYDEARDPSDTTWAGASWYGPTSGEYWRVNPREYADPRKHGPEYQSRARRRSTTTGEAWDPEPAEPAGPPTDRAQAHEPAHGPVRD
ncbi:MAG TPA: J domain-containing protein, partial [Candidatus Limnocylindrales bacterium]